VLYVLYVFYNFIYISVLLISLLFNRWTTICS